MELFFAAESRPFAIAAIALLGIIGIELAALLIGFSLSEFVEKSFDIGHHAPGDAPGGVAGALNWLNAGGVPFLILVMLVLGTFAAAGFVVQEVAQATVGRLPAALAVLPALAATLPAVRWSSRGIARLIPRDETYAVELADFVGLTAEVSVGPLDQGLPGQVRVKDAHGNWHVLRARAAKDAAPMPVGSSVLLVDRANAVFLAIPTPADLGPPAP